MAEAATSRPGEVAAAALAELGRAVVPATCGPVHPDQQAAGFYAAAGPVEQHRRVGPAVPGPGLDAQDPVMRRAS